MLIIKTFPEIHDWVKLPDGKRRGQIVEINHGDKTYTVKVEEERIIFFWNDELELERFCSVRTVGDTLEQRGKWVEIPWRRGYLFYGKHGTGKTTLIRAVTGEFKMDLYLINLAGAMDDSRFAHALASIPPRSAILLEDADATFEQREKNKDVSAQRAGWRCVA